MLSFFSPIGNIFSRKTFMLKKVSPIIRLLELLSWFLVYSSSYVVMIIIAITVIIIVIYWVVSWSICNFETKSAQVCNFGSRSAIWNIIYMINELDLFWVVTFIALRIYFISGIKFFWNEGIDTCFNVEYVLPGYNLVVTWWLLLVT